MVRLKLLVGVLLASAIWLSPPAVYAQEVWSDECVVSDVATIKGVGCLVGNMLSAALRLLGIVLFVMLVVGGIRYLTAGGDPKAVEAAKGTITAALTGLVLAILAWFLLMFLETITGVQLTRFEWRLPD